jgi:hypothetical protein
MIPHTPLFAVIVLQAVDDPLVVPVLFGFGALLLYGGFRQYRTKKMIENTPTEKVRSMAAGRTEVTGTAKPHGDVFAAPFTPGEALCATYEIEEHHHDDDGSDWVTIDSGTLTAPFEIDDGTGSVVVDANQQIELHVSDANHTRIDVDAGESEPEPIQHFLANNTSVDTGAAAPLDIGGEGGMMDSLFDDRRRYTQEVIPPESEVYCFGNAREREEGEDLTTGEDGPATDQRLVIDHDESTGRFILSDMSEAELTEDLGWSAPLLMAGGVIFLTAGFYATLTLLGIV